MAPLVHLALLAIALVPASSVAYDGTAEDAVFGSALASPPSDTVWDIPADAFDDALGRFDAVGSANVSGFDITRPTVDSSAQLPDWVLHVGVRANVPLAGSTDDSVALPPGVGLDEAGFALTVVGLRPPSPAASAPKDDAWTVCVVVFPGLTANATAAANDGDHDGFCNGPMGEACTGDLSMALLTAGGRKETGCRPVKVPQSCADVLPEDVVSYTFETTEENMKSGNFLALGSSVARLGDDAQLRRAVENVWPIFISWKRELDGGFEQTAGARCIRAADVTDPPFDAPAGGDDDDDEPSAAATMRGAAAWAAGVVAVAGLVAMA